jgi:hypothetical protein
MEEFPMKRILFFVLIFLVFTALNGFAENDIYFEPDSLHVQPGETIEISVMVSDMDSTFGAVVDMFFNPDVLEFESVGEGNFIPEPILMGGVPDSYPNIIDVGIGTTTGECIPGGGILFTLTLTAITDGSSALVIDEYPVSYWDCDPDEPQPFGSYGDCIIHVGNTDVESESWGKIKSNFDE